MGILGSYGKGFRCRSLASCCLSCGRDILGNLHVLGAGTHCESAGSTFCLSGDCRVIACKDQKILYLVHGSAPKCRYSGKGVADAYLHTTHSRNTGYGNTLDGPAYTAAGLCRDLGIAGQIQNGVFHQSRATSA